MPLLWDPEFRPVNDTLEQSRHLGGQYYVERVLHSQRNAVTFACVWSADATSGAAPWICPAVTWKQSQTNFLHFFFWFKAYATKDESLKHSSAMDLNGDDETFDFKINEEFAKRYEHNKQREELGKRTSIYLASCVEWNLCWRLPSLYIVKEKYGDVAVKDFDEDRLRKIAERKAKWGIRDDKDQSAVFYDSEEEESTDEEEDENAELLTPEVDAQIMKTIAAIRTKDPRVYDAKKEFFDGEEIEKAKKNWEEKQKQAGKKVTLKDYHREVLLEDGGIIDEDDEAAPAPKTHVQEQEEMKSDFKRAIMADDDDEDGFFTMRDKTSDDLAAEEEDYKRFLLESMAVSIWCIQHTGTMAKRSMLIPCFFYRTTRLERTLLLIGKTIEITRMLTRRKPF